MEASGPRACRVNRKEPSEVAATKSLIARAKAGKDSGSKLEARNLKIETTTNDKRPNVSNNLESELEFWVLIFPIISILKLFRISIFETSNLAGKADSNYL
jgi:hypothetical protein